MEVIGILRKKGETIQVSEKFKKREFVIELNDNPKYPEIVQFQLIQDNCPILDNFNIDSKIKIEFDLKGKKWTNPEGIDKYFNNLNAWRIESPDGNSGNSENSGTDGLPF
tara:strand:+ start:177 stop:506 length:330 start_codon:yes stop_codon:yes gene_type:complete